MSGKMSHALELQHARIRTCGFLESVAKQYHNRWGIVRARPCHDLLHKAVCPRMSEKRPYDLSSDPLSPPTFADRVPDLNPAIFIGRPKISTVANQFGRMTRRCPDDCVPRVPAGGPISPGGELRQKKSHCGFIVLTALWRPFRWTCNLKHGRKLVHVCNLSQQQCRRCGHKLKALRFEDASSQSQRPDPNDPPRSDPRARLPLAFCHKWDYSLNDGGMAPRDAMELLCSRKLGADPTC